MFFLQYNNKVISNNKIIFSGLLEEYFIQNQTNHDEIG
jgi:hypothetical protein